MADRFSKKRPFTTMRCNKVVLPKLSGFLQQLKDNLIHEAECSVANCRGQVKTWSNNVWILKLTRAISKTKHAVPSRARSVNRFSSLGQTTCDNLSMMKVVPTTPRLDSRQFGISFHWLAKGVDDTLVTSTAVPFVTRWFSVCKPSLLFNPIHYTLKTHKGPGKNSARLLHDQVCSLLAGLQHVCRYFLAQQVSRLDNVCCSRQLVSDGIAGPYVSNDMILAVFDVEDFFMKPHHPFLLDVCRNAREVAFLKPSIDFLLTEQWVSCPLLDMFYLVSRGSEMGSIDLCHLAFHEFIEAKLSSWPLSSTYCINRLRYRGDILNVARGIESLRILVHKICLLAQAMCTIEVKQLFHRRVDFLDISMYKYGSSLMFNPCREPVESLIALSVDSALPEGVLL